MRRRQFWRQKIGIGAALMAALAVSGGAARAQKAANGPVAVLTQHNDNARTGANLRETTLNTANINVATFGKLFTRTVEGYLYAQPLYVPNLNFPGKGRHNAVFLATSHNSVYAFDADDPKASEPLWTVNLGPSVPAAEVYTTRWTDMVGEIGITGTPTIDLPGHALFLVAKTKENGTYVQRFHALDLLTGHEKKGSPVEIKASVVGTGDAVVNGVVTFDPVKQLQRPALLLLGGVVYCAFGAHADSPPFHGWILGYDAKMLKPVCVFNTTPNGSAGSIWQAAMGMATDDAGNIYAMTGNGTFDADTGGSDYGDSILRLRPKDGSLSVEDYFTPYNQEFLSANDQDLGSSGPLLIPRTSLLMGGGKDGWLYLVNREKMGHYQAASNSQAVQTFPITRGNIHGSPVYWNGPGGPTVYVWPEIDHLMAFKLVDGKLQTTPASVSAVRVPLGMPGGFLSLSADGGKAGTGIVWSSAPFDDNANWKTVPGILRAYDASDLTHELWNSKMNADRDDVGMFAKFSVPTVANGKVYLSTFSNQLQVYGLLGNSPSSANRAAAQEDNIIPTGRPLIGRP